MAGRLALGFAKVEGYATFAVSVFARTKVVLMLARTEVVPGTDAAAGARDGLGMENENMAATTMQTRVPTNTAKESYVFYANRTKMCWV